MREIAQTRVRYGYRHIHVFNGSEFCGQLLDLWVYHHQARIDFSRPGKPTDNCHIETVNGSFRDECLHLHWFDTLDETKAIIEAWLHNMAHDKKFSLAISAACIPRMGADIPWVVVVYLTMLRHGGFPARDRHTGATKDGDRHP